MMVVLARPIKQKKNIFLKKSTQIRKETVEAR